MPDIFGFKTDREQAEFRRVHMRRGKELGKEERATKRRTQPQTWQTEVERTSPKIKTVKKKKGGRAAKRRERASQKHSTKRSIRRLWRRLV